jgi:hypothetical protein
MLICGYSLYELNRRLIGLLSGHICYYATIRSILYYTRIKLYIDIVEELSISIAHDIFSRSAPPKTKSYYSPFRALS